MYTLDTNAVIYHLHDEPSVSEFVESAIRAHAPLYLSSITITELLRFPALSPQEESAVLNFFSVCSVVPVDSSIARSAGMLGRIHNIKLADSIIAATALFTGSTLVMRNVRDFKNIPNLTLAKI